MTVKKLIEYVDKVKPNTFDIETKLTWINGVYSKIQASIWGLPSEDIKLFWGEDEEISIPYAYVDVYIYYIFAMIDMLRGEYDKYKMSKEEYNSEMSGYAKYIARGGK